MSAIRPYAVAGLAIATPMLLSEANAAGLPVPAYVTAGQRAAAASFFQPVLGVLAKDPKGADRLVARFVELRKGLVVLRGAADDRGLYAKLRDTDIDTICGALINAVRAGASTGEEAYRVTRAADLGGAKANQFVLEQILDGTKPDFALTPLGAALADVVLLRTQAAFGEPDVVDAQKRIAHLCVEADDVGYLVTGDPSQFETIGVFEALGVSTEWVASLPGKAAGALSGLVGDTIASAAMSTPGLIVIGFLLIRAVYK